MFLGVNLLFLRDLLGNNELQKTLTGNFPCLEIFQPGEVFVDYLLSLQQDDIAAHLKSLSLLMYLNGPFSSPSEWGRA